MTAPCITRLNRSIAEAGSELERNYLLAEKACYLARIGDYAEAEEIRGELRRGFGDSRDLKASVLVMLLEGLQSYFQSLSSDAKDRLLRAQLLSRASGNRELIAITSAWLAHVQFNGGDFPGALDSIGVASEAIESGQWAALGRISVLLGDIFLVVGNTTAAKQWYSHARHAAVVYGDQAALGAITYNQSAFRLFDLRLKAAVGLPVDNDALRLAAAEINSASNYQVASGMTSLDHLLIGVKASLEMLFERHAEALVLLSDLLQAGDVPENYWYRIVMRADAVLCCAILGLESDTRHHLSCLLNSKLDDLALDDQIIVYSNLNRAARRAPAIFNGAYSERNIEVLAERLSDQRAEFMPKLKAFEEIPSSLRW